MDLDEREIDELIKHPCPKDIVGAVFPHPVEGPLWDTSLLDDKRIKANRSRSHKSGVDIVIERLKPYNYQAGTLSRQFLKKEAKSHTCWQYGKSCMLYCMRCMVNVGDVESFHCYTVASIEYDTKESMRRNRAVLNVTAIYPHCSQCNCDPQWRRNIRMDNRNGGRGYEKLQFPHDEILRNTFQFLIDKFNKLGPDDEHYGMYMMYI